MPSKGLFKPAAHAHALPSREALLGHSTLATEKVFAFSFTMSRKGGFPQINISAFEDYIAGKQAILPELKNVEQLSPRVIRILGQNPGKVRRDAPKTIIITYRRDSSNN